MTCLISRRALLGTGVAVGGALWIGIRTPWAAADDSETLAGWIRIDADGRTTLLVNATELGQGSQSALAQILADELELDWQQVRVEMAPVEPAYYGVWKTYQTGGSGSVRGMFERLRTAGATARELLIRAAARRWNVPAETCTAQHGAVHHASSGRSAAYGELAGDAARLSPPSEVALKPRERWQLIGKPIPPLQQRARVNGSAVFGIDVQMPGLMCAAITQCPTLGGTLESVDPAPALRVAGVSRVVKLDNAVAVVAKDYWSARQGLAFLAPKWRSKVNPALNSDAIAQRLRELTKVEGTATVAKGESESDLRHAMRQQDWRTQRASSKARTRCRSCRTRRWSP